MLRKLVYATLCFAVQLESLFPFSTHSEIKTRHIRKFGMLMGYNF